MSTVRFQHIEQYAWNGRGAVLNTREPYLRTRMGDISSFDGDKVAFLHSISSWSSILQRNILYLPFMLVFHSYVLVLFSYLLTIYILQRLSRNYLVLRSLRLPGPLRAKLTSKWLLSKYIAGESMNTVHSLHLKYGPIVQTGPNEISFATATAQETIYGSNTLAFKSKVYDTFGPPSLFMFRDKEQHRERKRRIQHVFAPAVLRDVEPMIHSQISKFLQLLRHNQRAPWDVVKPTHMLTLDIGGEVLLGKDFGAQSSLEGKDTPYFLQVMPFVHPMFALNHEVSWLVKILELLPFKWTADLTGSIDYVYGYGRGRLNESIEMYGRHAHRRDLLTKLIAGEPEKGTLPLPDEDIGYEVGNFIYASTDSTAIVMSYIMYELASHPEWQHRIRRELQAAMVKDQGYPYQSLQRFPVLQACVHESMRLHPGIGPGLPRVTPPEGMEIDDIWIPGNVS
jgi:cytochrome P450